MVGLCNADDGDQTAFDEIDMRDHIAGRFQYLVHIEIDDFKVGAAANQGRRSGAPPKDDCAIRSVKSQLFSTYRRRGR
jgi:hypothetical protein